MGKDHFLEEYHCDFIINSQCLTLTGRHFTGTVTRISIQSFSPDICRVNPSKSALIILNVQARCENIRSGAEKRRADISEAAGEKTALSQIIFRSDSEIIFTRYYDWTDLRLSHSSIF